MPALLSTIFAIFCVYFGYRLVRWLSEIARMKRVAALIPGTDEELPGFGMALTWARMDSSQILDWELATSEKIQQQGHNVMRANFAHEVFIIPINGEAIKPIIDSKEEITKGLGYDEIKEWLGLGLLLSDGSKWQHRRRLITPTFHFRHLENYVKTFNNHSKVFAEVVSELNGAEFDAMPYVKRCALDVICDSAMGTCVNVQRNPSHPFLVALRDFLWVTTEKALKAQNWFYPYYYFSGNKKTYDVSLDVLHTFTKKVIAERKERRAKGDKTTGNETNFLDMLLEVYDAGEIDDEGVREEVDTFMFEGHDTTSSGVAWAVWCLAKHPEVQQKLYQEICDIAGSGDEPITTEHLKEMTYLDQVVKEVFRLYAPVPQVNRRLQGDFKSGDYIFPKGAIVTIAPIILARNRSIWGDDVLKFDPERFSPEREVKRHAFDYIPFSAGPRNCIGQRFALLEAKVMICWMIRSFELSATRPFDSLRTGSEAVLTPLDGIPVSAKRRTT
ncbi:unnamed protein product, partial [Mesorhabditis spiculigera]